MKPKEKAIELRSQFGENARYVCLEIIDTLKQIPESLVIPRHIKYWQEVKQELENLKN